jgi:hypothetical protein
MQSRIATVALATFAGVAAVVTVALSELLRSCAYIMTPTTVCGMGVCSSPLVCSAWAPAFVLGPCIGVVAGVGAAYFIVSRHRRAGSGAQADPAS